MIQQAQAVRLGQDILGLAVVQGLLGWITLIADDQILQLAILLIQVATQVQVGQLRRCVLPEPLGQHHTHQIGEGVVGARW